MDQIFKKHNKAVFENDVKIVFFFHHNKKKNYHRNYLKILLKYY